MPQEVVPVGVAIHCSDPRDPIWKLTKKLLIPEGKFYVQLAQLGHPICLAHQAELPHEFHGLMIQIHFALDTFPDVKEIMLIGHDCGYYNKIKHKIFTLRDKEVDLAKAAAFLKACFPKLRITAFFKYSHGGGFKPVSF